MASFAVVCCVLAVAIVAPMVTADQPWDKYQFAPANRTFNARSMSTICGPAPPLSAPSPSAQAKLSGVGNSITFDYGQEVGGISHFSFGSTSDASQTVNVAYSESSYYSCTGDASQGGSGKDGFVVIENVAANGVFVPDIAHLRGGFRYITLIMATNGSVEVNPPVIKMVAAPNMPDPSAWQNHFYSSDDMLNRIWYGCGWTTQLCAINSSHGRQWPAPKEGWNNSATCGIGDVILVDGAKRDRVIWPGDMGVSVLTAIATTGDIDASQNALTTLYASQLSNGMLPYAGPPVSFNGKSDTYHLWALIGTYNVAILGQQQAWLKKVWSGFQRGVATCTERIASDGNGLFTVVNDADWARRGQGGQNVAANALLFRVLNCGAEMANAIGDSTTAANYTATAAKLSQAINANLWNDTVGAFHDNPTSTILPQDGNSLMTWFNATTPERKVSISNYLKTNWNQFGSTSPEWGNNIGTFPGSMEVHAHFAAGQPERAQDLIRLMWGYMMNKTEGTQSTFWEGYNADGTFAYKGDYMSNSHGWATGPAAALTFNTLGIRPTGLHAYQLAPHPGSITSCEGSWSFGPGQSVLVKWNNTIGREFTLTVDSSKAVNTVGDVVIDLLTKPLKSITLNGKHLWTNTVGAVVESESSDLRSDSSDLRSESSDLSLFSMSPTQASFKSFKSQTSTIKVTYM